MAIWRERVVELLPVRRRREVPHRVPTLGQGGAAAPLDYRPTHPADGGGDTVAVRGAVRRALYLGRIQIRDDPLQDTDHGGVLLFTDARHRLRPHLLLPPEDGGMALAAQRAEPEGITA